VIRVVIVDDQELVRAGFELILEAPEDIEVVGIAADGAEGLQIIRDTCPDVVLMDIRMPGMDGLEATRRIGQSLAPQPHVLILTTFDTDEHVYSALHAGAAGFLLKTTSPDRLIDAIRLIAAGESLLAPSVTRRLIEAFVQRPSGAPGRDGLLAGLTARELDVLGLLGRGLSNQQIAEALVVSTSTVKTHVNRLFAKLGTRDRVGAVILAYETGLVRPGDQAPTAI